MNLDFFDEPDEKPDEKSDDRTDDNSDANVAKTLRLKDIICAAHIK